MRTCKWSPTFLHPCQSEALGPNLLVVRHSTWTNKLARYAPLCGTESFRGRCSRLANGAWSVELTFDEPPPEQGGSRASDGFVRFLVDEAPHERLARGVRFDLYEGLTPVAQVEVLD